MKKNETINVSGVENRVTKFNDEDYICLTDMLKAKDGEFFITDWLRNRNTLEYIGIWEKVYNPDFNYGEFATIRNQSGLNSFKIGVQEFAERTSAICIKAKAGRYGGTYAHKDIAFEVAMWISAEFKIYIVKESHVERQPARLRDDQPTHLHLQHGEHQRGDDQRRNPAAATPEAAERNRHPSDARPVASGQP